MDFTCWDWIVVLYQSMERIFFAGDGPVVMVEGMLNEAVVS